MKSYFRKVNYYETDKMGVVHHSNYFRYFEEARTSFMEQCGYPYSRLEAEGIISPVVSISCRYRKPLRYGESMEIRVYLTRMSRVKTAFRYEVLDAATGELRATGESEHGYLDENGRIVSVEKTAGEYYAVFLAEEEPAEGAVSRPK